MQSAATLQASTGQGAQRLFFALWPDAPTRQRLVAAVAALRARHATAGRWLDPARYHLTLHFLGDFAPLAPALVAQVCAAAQAVDAPAFALRLDQAGSFASRDHPWWLGCGAPPPALFELWRQLDSALDRAGVPRESCRDFVPHLTVLRRARLALPVTELEPLVWPVDAFVLVASAAGSTAGHYRLLRRFALRA